MNHKLIMILVGIIIFIVGVGVGVILQSKVLQEPSLSDQLLESSYIAAYGEDYEQQIEDDLLRANDIQSRAQDTERKTDINALHTQYEVYYNDYGYYPTLEIATDATNFPGLDTEALIDPSGRSLNTDGSDYLYEVVYCNQEGCREYELSTILDSDESMHRKNSLN